MNCLKVVKCLIVCLLYTIPGVVSAQGQYDFCAVAPSGQMLYYRIERDRACAVVTHPEKEWPYYAGNKPVGDLVVPDSVRHGDMVYRVVGVGENAFYRCDSLTGFSARGITYIGTQSFCGCTMLKTIEFPASLRRVGEGRSPTAVGWQGWNCRRTWRASAFRPFRCAKGWRRSGWPPGWSGSATPRLSTDAP